MHEALTEVGSPAGPRPPARAACTCWSGSSAAGPSIRCGAPRWRWRATSSAARRTLATSAWWKEERRGVFIDYNQNAKDRTVASAYSVRPKPDARVSTPVTWQELEDCDPADFTLWTVPKRWQTVGDPHAAIDARADSIEPLLELSARHEAEGQGDAPWPPHYRKAAGEPKRAAAVGAAHKAPLIEIARADREDDAVAAAEAWKAAHPEAAAHLAAGRRADRPHARQLVAVVSRADQPDAGAAEAAAESAEAVARRRIAPQAPNTFASSYGVVTSSWS